MLGNIVAAKSSANCREVDVSKSLQATAHLRCVPISACLAAISAGNWQILRAYPHAEKMLFFFNQVPDEWTRQNIASPCTVKNCVRLDPILSSARPFLPSKSRTQSAASFGSVWRQQSTGNQTKKIWFTSNWKMSEVTKWKCLYSVARTWVFFRLLTCFFVKRT